MQVLPKMGVKDNLKRNRENTSPPALSYSASDEDTSFTDSVPHRSSYHAVWRLRVSMHAEVVALW